MPSLNSPPLRRDLNVKAGDTLRLIVRVYVGGVCQALSGWSASGQIRAARDPASALLATFACSVATDSKGDYFAFLLSAVNTRAAVAAAIAAGVASGFFDLHYVTASGDDVTPVEGVAIFDQTVLP